MFDYLIIFLYQAKKKEHCVRCLLGGKDGEYEGQLPSSDCCLELYFRGGRSLRQFAESFHLCPIDLISYRRFERALGVYETMIKEGLGKGRVACCRPFCSFSANRNLSLDGYEE